MDTPQQVFYLTDFVDSVESLLHRLHSEDDTSFSDQQKQKIEKATENIINNIKDKLLKHEKIASTTEVSTPRKGRQPKSPIKHSEIESTKLDERVFKNLELGAEETNNTIKKLQSVIPKTQKIAENLNKVLNENFGKPENSVEKSLKKRKVTDSNSKQEKNSSNTTPSRTRKRLSSIQ